MALRVGAAPLRRVIAIAACTAVAAAAGARERLPLPKDAQRAIDRVHAAALARDDARLHALMTADFKRNFGADGDTAPDRVLADWRADPKMLETLARVTGQPCERQVDDFIACPANAGMDWRAGFHRRSGVWRLSSFLAGD